MNVLPLVLLPGMDGTGLFFEPFLRAWGNSSEAQVVAYPENEPLGYGDLESIVREKLPEQPYVLLAESFSGPLAVMLATKRAAGRLRHLKGIILCATFVCNPYPALTVLKNIPFLPPVSMLPAGLVGQVLWGAHGTPALRSTLETVMRRVATPVWQRRLQEVLLADQVRAFSGIDMPVLCLRATRDRLIPPDAAELIRSRGRNVRLVDIDAPHLLLQCATGAAIDAVGGFMKAV